MFSVLISSGILCGLYGLAEEKKWSKIKTFAGFLASISLLLCIATFFSAIIFTENYEPQTVAIVTESGVVEKISDTYFKDEEDNYYIKSKEKMEKRLWVPFYFELYEKVDAPTFKIGDLMVMKDDSKVTNPSNSIHCTNCNSDLSQFGSPKFCYACGEQIYNNSTS